MILTTPTKQPYTTTKHNHKGYIFTLYLFMLLCVVGNCLLFYCSCTGNCENCCGINDNASVSGGIKDKSESEIKDDEYKNKKNDKKNNSEINNQQNNEIKYKHNNENKIKDDNKNNMSHNVSNNLDNNKKKKEEKKEEKKEDDKIEIKDNDKIKNKIENKDKIEIKNKLEEVKISDYGEIGNIQIVNAKFVNLVNVHKYTGSSDNYEAEKKEFLNNINPTGQTYLSAYVEVKDNGTVTLRCFIHCIDANSIYDNYGNYNGLFQESKATKIVILRCGSGINNMSYMFYNCRSLTELNLSSFNTNKVTNMRNMFNNCSSLTILDLSNFNTTNVTEMFGMFNNCRSLTELNLSSLDTENVTNMSNMFNNCSKLLVLNLSSFNTSGVTNMSCMFNNCISLTNLDLSNFNTDNVTDMIWMFTNCSSLKKLNLSKFNTNKVTNMFRMFFNCFTEEQPSTLICTASTIQKITENVGSRLIIQNEKKAKINNIIGNNKNREQVYTCIVNRCVNEDNPQIIAVEEYNKAGLFKLKNMPESGKIDDIQIVDANFAKANLVNASRYRGSTEEDYNDAKKEFLNSIDTKVETTYLSAYVEVKDNGTVTLRCFIHCTDANSKTYIGDIFYYGLFQESKATKIVILRCGNNITNMSNMFYKCISLTELDLSKLNTSKVINMSNMFTNCNKLTNIKFPDNFTTNTVTDMIWMFAYCSSLSNLDLSNFNIDNVINMENMFYNCFTEEQTSTLICKASTIKKITENKNSCLIIPNKNKCEINNIIGNNKNREQVYTCIVKRGGNEDNPQIIAVEEYNKAGLFKLKNMPESGKIDDIQIVDANFAKANLVNASRYRGSTEEDYNEAKNKFLESIMPTGEKYLSAYVEVKDKDKVKLRCFIHCTDANSKTYIDNIYYKGLFHGSKATEIEILRCGSGIKNMSWMFYNCSSLKELNLSNFNTDKVKNMSYMFYNCSGLTNIDLSNFTTNNVTNMGDMFAYCSSLTELNLSKFNTNTVEDMRNMFFDCSSLTNLNLSKFNTQNVTCMFGMFNNCSSLNNLDLSNWETHNVTNMSFMFNECSKLTKLNLSSFNTQNVTDMSWMFYNCSGLTNLDLSNFNTDNVTDISSMFSKCFREKQTSILICTSSTIQNITENKNSCLIIPNKNKDEIKNIIGNNKNLKQVYTCIVKRGGNEDNPQIIEVVEYNKAGLCLFKLKNMPESGKIDDIQIVDANFAKENLVNASRYIGSTEKDYNDAKNEFLNSIDQTGEKTHLYAYVEVEDNNKVKLRYFIHCTDANSREIKNNFYNGLFQESKATKIVIINCGSEIKNMSWMFSNCSSLTNLDLSSFNTNNVTNMICMFHNCSSLKNLDLSKFNTNNVINMRSMFYNCSSLTELDLSNFDTRQVIEMHNMFSNCSSLTNLDLSNFDTNKVENIIFMFSKCFKNEATLICQASTIQKIANIGGSCLIIEDNNVKEIVITNNNNPEQVYICSVKRVGNNPEITGVVKYLKLKNMPGSGKIDNIQIVNKRFAEENLVKYVQIGSEEDKQELKKIMNKIDTTCETHLSAYVEVEDNNKVKLRYFIHCTNANSVKVGEDVYALFHGSVATKIEILSCGTNVTNMSCMFCDCSSLTELDLSNFKTSAVVNMSYMFCDCSSLTILDLSKFTTNIVTNMICMFSNCSSLTKLDLFNFNTSNVTDMCFMFNNCSSLLVLNLSNFKTQNVTDMFRMFNNCFQNKATLICTASILKKITEKKNSCLIIPNENENNNKINDILNKDNKGKVCKCSVKRVGSNPEITDVEEYQLHQ